MIDCFAESNVVHLPTTGEQDHWLFEQPLSNSIGIVPADIYSCNLDKSCDYGDLLSDCPGFVSPTIKNEVLYVPTSVPMTVEAPSIASVDGLDGHCMTEKENISSFTDEGIKKRLSPESLNLMEGLTEFIPWTGFDYSSDGDFDEDEVDDVTSAGAATKKKRKRTSQKQPSADADLIATATEENLRKLGIDPDSNEGKKQRRKIRNRLSAQLHRERKKGYISYLEGLVKERDVKLSTVSLDMSRILSENVSLRLKLEIASGKRNENTDYSSGAGHTDSDTGEDSDTVSISSETATATSSTPSFTPKRSYKIGSRFKGSKIGSAFSVFSAVLMISITVFGPFIQNMNPIQFEPDNSPLLITIAENHDVIMPSLKLPENEEVQTLDLDSVNKQLIPSRGRKLQSTTTNEYDTTELSDRTRPSTPSLNGAESDATSLIPATSSGSNRLVFNSQNSALLPKNQALWQFHDHITDLYPPFENYYSPNTESSGNYTTGKIEVHVNERKHLRRRVANDSSIPLGDDNSVSDHVHMVPNVQDLSDNMGKTLVSVHSLISSMQSPSLSASRSSSPRPRSRPSQPSLEFTADAAPQQHASVSRILLTQGRALLDPSLVMRPQGAKSNVVPTPKEDTVTDALLKTLSTWTGGRSSDEPPVVRVGVNPMGTSPVDPQSSAGNMLVMLLPASAVRWGKNWGDSSEGTMEAMLKGLNFTDSAYGAHGRNMGGESGSGESDDGMWIEIGCSVFRAQLVRNVTLSS
jgi:bZIP transcription factor